MTCVVRVRRVLACIVLRRRVRPWKGQRFGPSAWKIAGLREARLGDRADFHVPSLAHGRRHLRFRAHALHHAGLVTRGVEFLGCIVIRRKSVRSCAALLRRLLDKLLRRSSRQ